jgi:hypothetical protein
MRISARGRKGAPRKGLPGVGSPPYHFVHIGEIRRTGGTDLQFGGSTVNFGGASLDWDGTAFTVGGIPVASGTPDYLLNSISHIPVEDLV